MDYSTSGSGARLAALIEWAEALARGGRWDQEAAFVNARIIQLEPTNESACTRLAGCCLVTGDLSRAEQMFRAALALNPENVHARNGLADVLARSNPPRFDANPENKATDGGPAGRQPLDRQKAG